MDYTTCRPGRRCNQWRTCPHCAAVRQAQLADRAERAYARTGGYLTYAVVIPACDADIAAVRTSITQHLPARGGLWAVQVGERVRGLHIDLIAAADQLLDAVSIGSAINRPADVWAQPITAADLRNVVAYATRRNAMPSADEYRGHLVGTFGGWRSARDVLLTAAAAPQSSPPVAVRAAIVQAELHRDDNGIAPDAREAARRHIRGLLDALRRG